jgi:hypothetical protein
MSEEDANSIRRAYEVWNESGPAAVTEQFWAEDAVYREGPGWPMPVSTKDVQLRSHACKA